MVRHSSMAQWLKAHPDENFNSDDAPDHGCKTWKRNKTPFSGVFVGIRTMRIKRWWWSRDHGHEPDFYTKLIPITFWLVAYKTRAKPRYVLPRDVEIVEAKP
jgi:hypothetical protein